METLYLNIKSQFFNEILSGSKKSEFRDATDYYIDKLLEHEYDSILFKNGYNKNSPALVIEIKKIIVWDDVIEFKLGKILERRFIPQPCNVFQ